MVHGMIKTVKQEKINTYIGTSNYDYSTLDGHRKIPMA